MTQVDNPHRISLDLHAHLIPAILPKMGPLAGIEWNREARRLKIDGNTAGPPELNDPGTLLDWMDRHDVGRAWISIPPPAYRQKLDEAAARDWIGYVNDGLAAIAEDSGGRLSALLHLPIEHPALAEEIVKISGAQKFSMAAGAGQAVRLSDLVYEPLWSALARQTAFLFIHPGTTCDPRLDRYFLRNLVGNPVETGVAAAHLLLGGVLDRHQHLTICLAHGGGILPAVADRMDHGHAAGMIKDGAHQDRPVDTIRRFSADCITLGPSALRLAAHAFGEDGLYFGSDWPFPMGIMDPHAQLSWLGSADRRRILQTNGLDLLARFGEPERADRDTKHERG